LTSAPHWARCSLVVGTVAVVVGAACGTASREHTSYCLYYSLSAACPVGSVADALVRGALHPPTYTDVSVDANHPAESVNSLGGPAEKKCCYAVDYTVNP
jgi:hypothetical protein